MVHKMWDETGKRVVLPSRTKVSDTWHAMVTKMGFIWGWFDSGQTMGLRCSHSTGCECQARLQLRYTLPAIAPYVEGLRCFPGCLAHIAELVAG